MNAPCTTNVEALLAWWLGETSASEAARLDEHLFGCSQCAARLNAIVALGGAIRSQMLKGDFGFVVPGAFISRMKAAGLTLREYHVAPGGSVNCTIAPTDDFVVANLAAPLAGVQRLDVLIDDTTFGRARLTDVPFDPAAGGLSVVPSAMVLRSLKVATQHMQLVAVGETGERVIGHYTFNHAPFEPG